MPNFYRLCWGLNSVACLYGSSISDNISLQTGGTDALTIDLNQAVVMSGALSVTGATTLTGAVTLPDATIVTAKIDPAAVTTSKIDTYAVTTTKIDPAAVTTAKIDQQAVTTIKMWLDLTSTGLVCVTTARRLGVCTSLTPSTGACGTCN